MLKIENLSKSFGKLEVLKDLNLEVQEGSVFGLVGVNGAGKSTLLRCIAGVYEPDAGNILLDQCNTFTDENIRKHIAFVADEFWYPFAAAIKSMKVFYRSLYDFDEEAYQKYLKMFDLDENLQIANLSKGNKRRVSLLFALSIHAKLLLLDEAYDGLEPLARYRFKKALAELIEEENITVIISSHNLRELEDICDSYGILEEGKIISYGDLLENRGLVNKYQTAFHEDLAKENFKGFDLLHYEKEGMVYTLVIRGDEEEVMEKLKAMNPILLNTLPVSFEELFIYELEERGYGDE